MKALTAEDLAAADEGSYYTILGCGGPLEKWVEMVEAALQEHEAGTPTEWFSTTGASINLYAAEKLGGPVRSSDKFKDDITALMFPLTNLNVGILAALKLQTGDRWFDDVIANMRRRRA